MKSELVGSYRRVRKLRIATREQADETEREKEAEAAVQAKVSLGRGLLGVDLTPRKVRRAPDAPVQLSSTLSSWTESPPFPLGERLPSA